MTIHSLFIRDAPQKMMSSGVRFSPVCQGQAPGYATSPPTIRLGFLTPQVSELSVGPGTGGGAGAGGGEDGYGGGGAEAGGGGDGNGGGAKDSYTNV